ncbi:MAG: Gfo/Idh/MocA family oxidoreductase [Geminicoccaceae bacterium]
MRYAIIGSGMMGQEHIENIRLLPESRVVALADPDEGMRRQAAARCDPDVRVFTDYRELLGAGGFDALVVVTPNYTHCAVLLDALATGLPILTEKPLCTTVEDCDRVLAAAAGRAAPVWVAMEYRFMPPVARLIEEVRQGTVGKLRMLSIREHRFPFLKKVGDWNRFARNTGGTMVEKCCHYFDLMRLITGAEPVRLYASGGQDVNHLDEAYGGERPDIVDNGYVTVDFANGVRAMLDLCMFAEVSRDQEEIAAVGELGKVECATPSSRLWIGRRDTGELTREVVPVDEQVMAAGQHHGSTYYQHRAFQDLVRNGGRPAVSLHDGRMAVVMGAAAERSMREQTVVTF